ncbi:hypothetical protein TNCV_595381 [Trichonephila clavipes]|nr:hypothetical protein TNCV_595381 [Trichonephila clavipes]
MCKYLSSTFEKGGAYKCSALRIVETKKTFSQEPQSSEVVVDTSRMDSTEKIRQEWTATAGSDVVQSGRPIFDDFFQHLWPYIGNNTANVVFQMVKRLWLIRIDQ